MWLLVVVAPAAFVTPWHSSHGAKMTEGGGARGLPRRAPGVFDGTKFATSDAPFPMGVEEPMPTTGQDGQRVQSTSEWLAGWRQRALGYPAPPTLRSAGGAPGIRRRKTQDCQPSSKLWHAVSCSRMFDIKIMCHVCLTLHHITGCSRSQALKGRCSCLAHTITTMLTHGLISRTTIY